jgi:hypothetical protein
VRSLVGGLADVSGGGFMGWAIFGAWPFFPCAVFLVKPLPYSWMTTPLIIVRIPFPAIHAGTTSSYYFSFAGLFLFYLF